MKIGIESTSCLMKHRPTLISLLAFFSSFTEYRILVSGYSIVLQEFYWHPFSNGYTSAHDYSAKRFGEYAIGIPQISQIL